MATQLAAHRVTELQARGGSAGRRDHSDALCQLEPSDGSHVARLVPLRSAALCKCLG